MNRTLFRQAYTAGNSKLQATALDIKTNNEQVDKVINLYNNIINSIPYPLNKIEDDIKYIAIADGIKSRITSADLWVDNGICVALDNKQAIRIKGKLYNTFLITEKLSKSMLDYKESDIFKEFNWLSERLKAQKSLKDYYKIFMMSELREAKKDKQSFEHKLLNILTTKELNNIIRPKENTVLFGDSEYTLDIYLKTYETNKIEEVTEIRNGKINTVKQKQVLEYFDYDTYKKQENIPIQKVDCQWIGAIFGELVARYEYLGWLSYTGIVFNGDLYFSLDNAIYKSSIDKYTTPELIVRGLKLFGYDKESVYLQQIVEINNTEYEIIYDVQDLSICQERVLGVNV